MGLKRGRRAQSMPSRMYYVLLELAVFALFATSVLIKVNSAVGDQTYYQTFITKDVALISESMYAAEGDFIMYYDYSTPKPSKLDFLLEKGKFTSTTVEDLNPLDKNVQSSAFAVNSQKENITFGSSESKYNYGVNAKDPDNQNSQAYSRRFTIEKKDSNITISDDDRNKDVALAQGAIK